LKIRLVNVTDIFTPSPPPPLPPPHLKLKCYKWMIKRMTMPPLFFSPFSLFPINTRWNWRARNQIARLLHVSLPFRRKEEKEDRVPFFFSDFSLLPSSLPPFPMRCKKKKGKEKERKERRQRSLSSNATSFFFSSIISARPSLPWSPLFLFLSTFNEDHILFSPLEFLPLPPSPSSSPRRKRQHWR